jgi:hypothetical protein
MNEFIYCVVCLRNTPHQLMQYNNIYGGRVFACVDCGNQVRK